MQANESGGSKARRKGGKAQIAKGLEESNSAVQLSSKSKSSRHSDQPHPRSKVKDFLPHNAFAKTSVMHLKTPQRCLCLEGFRADPSPASTQQMHDS